MLGVLERYVLRRVTVLFAGLAALALAILLLERMLRIVEMVSGSSGTMTSAALLIINLVPHYLEMALPAALFLSVLITTERLSRGGELVVMMGAGVSLFRFARPIALAALLLAGFAVLITGFAQPFSRYEYRQIAHDIRQRSANTAFQEGKFVQIDDYIVWTDHVRRRGADLADTFILEYLEDGSRRFLAAPSGHQMSIDSSFAGVRLENGMGSNLPAGEGQGSLLSYDALDWVVPGTAEAFRPRGNDERELTLPELQAVASGRTRTDIPPHVAAAALHDQLAWAMLILVLPLLAIPLGLNYGRVPRAGGLAAGIVLMLLVQKGLEFGMILAERGTVAPWAGSWSVLFFVAALGVAVFWRNATQISAPPPALLSIFGARAHGNPRLSRWRMLRS